MSLYKICFLKCKLFLKKYSMKKLSIVIIGWTGKFWMVWKKYFERKWHNVIISSNNTQLKPEKAVKLGDIIIISVPIRNTVDVIKNIIPFIPDNKLLIDFTGIKKKASLELSKYTRGEVVATHPMFWPWVESLNNQNIIYDPINPWKKWDLFYAMLKEDKANFIQMESDKHDELIWIVQSSVHIINLMFWHILKKRWINLEDLIKISTPNSRMQICILARFLNQNASLYTDMQMHNEVYKNEILPDIKNYFNFIDDFINEKNTIEFENEFNDIKNYFGNRKIKKAFDLSEKIDLALRDDF